MILKVYTDVGEPEPIVLYAKVFQKAGDVYTIKYLSPTQDRSSGKVIHRYEEDEYQITDESITEYISGDEEGIGFVEVDNGFIKEDSDSDYESETESEESESESVVESEPAENFYEDINEES